MLNAVRGIRDQLDRRGNEVQGLLYELHGLQSGVRTPDAAEGKDHAYRQTVDRIRESVHAHVPQDATVLVASRGDEDLVKLYGRRAWHFPRLANGTYLGHHPANSEAAIVHLETMRALGATHFVLPEPSRWWLDHYAELSHHLETRCRVVFRNDDVCRIYSLLDRPRGAGTVETDALGELVAEFRARFDRDPMILNWDTGRDLGRDLAEVPVFAPPAPLEGLDYLDHTIDIVALASRDPARLDEAERVASAAVVVFEDPAGTCAGRRIRRCARSGSHVARRGVVVPAVALDRGAVLRRRRAHARVPRHACTRHHSRARVRGHRRRRRVTRFHPQLLVRHGARAPVVTRHSERSKRGIPRVGEPRRGGGNRRDPSVLEQRHHLVRGLDLGAHRNVSQISRCRRRRRKAVVPRRPGAGGRRNGLPRRIGGQVRRVRSRADCTDLQLRARRRLLLRGAPRDARALFEQLDGFDPAYAPGYYEDTDYCFRVREQGLRVLYQPASAIVHVEGGTAGLDVSTGMKRYQVVNHQRFVERWREVLADAARPPGRAIRRP